MGNFRSKSNEMVEYVEKVSENIVEEVIVIGSSGDYDLIIVGKGRFPSNMVVRLVYYLWREKNLLISLYLIVNGELEVRKSEVLA